MSKYNTLWEYIKNSNKEQLVLTYEDIKNIIGVDINHSFLTYKNELYDYGYIVNKISITNKTIGFNKINDKIKFLYDKDDKVAYKKLKELEILSLNSNELYEYLDDFIEMLDNSKDYIKVRGFRLLCLQAKWDINNIINKRINKIISILDDLIPTSLRQCLASINNLLLYKPELSDTIKNKLLKIDYLKYKDTMQGLIKKDIDNIINNL